MEEHEFKVGQEVKATGTYGYMLTKGKTYTVTKYEPKYPDGTFTWPAYVTVLGDNGKAVTGHADRFAPIEESNHG